jgi:DNA polymerase IV
VQLTLPFGRKDTTGLDHTLDAVHDRFGKSALRRAVNMNRSGFEVPMLPD